MRKSKISEGHSDKERQQLKKAGSIILPCILSRVLVSFSVALQEVFWEKSQCKDGRDEQIRTRLQGLWITESLLSCTSAMGNCNAAISLTKGLALLEGYLVRLTTAA